MILNVFPVTRISKDKYLTTRNKQFFEIKILFISTTTDENVIILIINVISGYPCKVK